MHSNAGLTFVGADETGPLVAKRICLLVNCGAVGGSGGLGGSGGAGGSCARTQAAVSSTSNSERRRTKAMAAPQVRRHAASRCAGIPGYERNRTATRRLAMSLCGGVVRPVRGLDVFV